MKGRGSECLVENSRFCSSENLTDSSSTLKERNMRSVMLNSKRAVVLAAVLLLICFTALPSAMAQTDRGTITGTVTDASGGTVAGAAVTATSQGTGTVSRATTGANGGYTIPLL